MFPPELIKLKFKTEEQRYHIECLDALDRQKERAMTGGTKSSGMNAPKKHPRRHREHELLADT